MKKLFALFTSAALLFVSSVASAVPIDGSIKEWLRKLNLQVNW